MRIKRLDHRPAQLLRNPPALGRASFDPVDAAVALLRIVVAGVYDDHVVWNSGKQIGWQVGHVFLGYLEGVLPAKYKELMGLVASACLRCDDCINYHIIHLTILRARRESLRITYQALSFFAPGRMGLSDLPDFDLTHEMVKKESGYDTHAEDA